METYKKTAEEGNFDFSFGYGQSKVFGNSEGGEPSNVK